MSSSQALKEEYIHPCPESDIVTHTEMCLVRPRHKRTGAERPTRSSENACICTHQSSTPHVRTCARLAVRCSPAPSRWRPQRQPSWQVGGRGRGQAGSPEGTGPCLAGYRAPALGKCLPPALPVTAPRAPPRTSPQIHSLAAVYSRLGNERAAITAAVQLPPALRGVQVGSQHGAPPRRPHPPSPPGAAAPHATTYLSVLSPAPQVTHCFQGASALPTSPQPRAGRMCQPTFQPAGSSTPGASSGRRPAPSTGPMLSANSVSTLGEFCWVRPKACPPDTSWTGPSEVAPAAWKGSDFPGAGTARLLPLAGVPWQGRRAPGPGLAQAGSGTWPDQ